MFLRTFGGARPRRARPAQDLDIFQQIELHHGLGDDKMRRYCELLRAIFADQLAWIGNRRHERKITGENGCRSVEMAAAATRSRILQPSSASAMLPRLFNCCLLRPEDLRPSQDDLKIAGVFNPGAAATPEGVVLLVRVAEAVAEKRPGFVGLPRWETPAGCVIIDWLLEGELVFLDPRVVRIKATGLLRLTFTSHLRIVRCGDGRTVDSIDSEFFQPADHSEEYGVEDPRITPIGDGYYITYVAVSRHGAATALAFTRDFRSFERRGIIFCPENKDVVLFPGKIGAAYWALHRPTTAHAFSHPEMWLASSPDLQHWGSHQYALARAVDLKDGYTHQHSARVAQYAAVLAREFGMSEEEIDQIRTAGILHDVGKVGVADAVLLKPARLTDDEFLEMQRHSTLGRDIVAGAGMPEIADWVLYLHERWDGRGYPEKLEGDEIPLASRVLGVADAFEAMTSSRLYRRGMAVEKALDELEKSAGKQFDPDVALRMVELVRSGAIPLGEIGVLDVTHYGSAASSASAAPPDEEGEPVRNVPAEVPSTVPRGAKRAGRGSDSRARANSAS